MTDDTQKRIAEIREFNNQQKVWMESNPWHDHSYSEDVAWLLEQLDTTRAQLEAAEKKITRSVEIAALTHGHNVKLVEQRKELQTQLTERDAEIARLKARGET